MTKVVFIGAGNLATQLSKRMRSKGFDIMQVYSYTRQSAEKLANELGCDWTTNLNEVRPDADMYVFAVKDAVLVDTISQLEPNGGIWVHTAGSISKDVFEGYSEKYGVFYPLQTFSKERDVNFDRIPFFIESNNHNVTDYLLEQARKLSQKVFEADSDQRKHLHLAAVFACNFTNHMYAISQQILQDHNLHFDAIAPLIEETAKKVQEISARQAQTGPAVRYDQNVMNNQIEMLDDETLKDIYRVISKNIHNYTKD